MKKLVIVCFAVFSMGLNLNAQTVKQDVKKDAKAVGNKTAEVASKTASKVADEKYKDKVAPGGQNVYIDGHSRYYWIDKKGHKNYVSKSQLRDK